MNDRTSSFLIIILVLLLFVILLTIAYEYYSNLPPNRKVCVEEKVDCYDVRLVGKMLYRDYGNCSDPQFDQTEKKCVLWELRK